MFSVRRSIFLKMINTDHLNATTKSAVLLEGTPLHPAVSRLQSLSSNMAARLWTMPTQSRAARASQPTSHSSAAVGIKVVVVHGGGKAITRALAESNVETRFEHGLRVTDKDSVKSRRAHTQQSRELSTSAKSLQARRALAHSAIAGNDVLVCNKKDVVVDGEHVDVGFVGETHTVKTKIIKKALNDGYIPVISPIACDEDGQSLQHQRRRSRRPCGRRTPRPPPRVSLRRAWPDARHERPGVTHLLAQSR